RNKKNHSYRDDAIVKRISPVLDERKLIQAQKKICKVVPRTWNRRSARVLSGRKTREGEAALRVSRRPEALQNSPVIAADPQVVLAPAPGTEVAQRVSLVETPLRSWIVQPGGIREAEARNSPVKRILRDPADSRLAGDVCQKGVQVGRGRMQVVVIESQVVRESSSPVGIACIRVQPLHVGTSGQ